MLKKVIFPLAAKHVRRGKAQVLKNRSHDRSNSKSEEKFDSFDVSASFKNRWSRSDIVLGRYLVSYWRTAVVAWTVLHITTEINLSD